MHKEIYNNLKIKCYKESNGCLFPIDLSYLPFEPKRIFYVTNTPKGEIRGKHAHFNTQQILVCIQGIILVKLYDIFSDIG